MTNLTFENVRFDGGFFAALSERNRSVTIPVEYAQSRDTGRIDAFRLAYKPGNGVPEPHIFWDSDVAKWIEAASYSLASHPDPELDALVDGVAGLIAASQQPDGYINSHYTAVEPGNRFTNLQDCHELYCAGHLIEAAVAHKRATGKDTLLSPMMRYADYLCTVFGRQEGQIRGYPGHEEIELALVKLYELTGKERYLALSSYFVEERGQSPNYFTAEAERLGRKVKPEYLQAHIPVRQQTAPVGHAVRAMYLYTAMADLARLKNDPSLFEACDRLWSVLTEKFMYITGGIGSSASNEGFKDPWELPNAEAYCETCAGVGLIFFTSRMLANRCDAKYGDVLERALFNNVLAGVSESGDRFFYANPLECVPFRNPWGPQKEQWYRRSEWFGCACCPSNLSRLTASLGSYFITCAEGCAALHLYGDLTASLPGGERIEVRSGYPFDGKITVRVSAPGRFRLKMRIPGWCKSYRFTDPDYTVEDGYAIFDRVWDGPLELELDMPPRREYASPLVAADAGCTALCRGPIVYCAEECDNAVSLPLLRLPRASRLSYADGRITADALALRADAPLYSGETPEASPAGLVFTPYFRWGNRGEGRMRVFIPEI